MAGEPPIIDAVLVVAGDDVAHIRLGTSDRVVDRAIEEHAVRPFPRPVIPSLLTPMKLPSILLPVESAPAISMPKASKRLITSPLIVRVGGLDPEPVHARSRVDSRRAAR